jgi:uncharacterized membrane protein required for colicin V production
MEINLMDALLLLLVVAGGIWGLAAGAVRVMVPFSMVLVMIFLAHSYPDISSRFGNAPYFQFFVFLLLIFAGILVFGFLLRALHAAVHASGLAPVNKLVGFGLGLVVGSVLAGASVWWLKTYGGSDGQSLLGQSLLAPGVFDFFQIVMAFIQRLFPWDVPVKEPWWKRALW